MEVRPDTSSSRSQDGWSFLNSTTGAQTSTRSLPPSSYMRSASDRSSALPLPSGHQTYAYNGSVSRSSTYSHSRNIPSASTGARSTTTIPSQPVTTRVNSLYDHNHRRPGRGGMRPIKKINDLPAPEELSIQGILSAIYEDIEGDLNTISEVLGRSRFMLADQYENQMPPQGEIVMHNEALEGIDEVPSVGDDVMILNEDASLQEGSNSGSAAYRMMERLQTVSRNIRVNSDVPVVHRTTDSHVTTMRTQSSPVVSSSTEIDSPVVVQAVHDTVTESRRTFSTQSRQGPSRPVVSETYLSAEADGAFTGVVPVVSEAGRHYPLYGYDDTSLFEPTSLREDPVISLPERSETRRADIWNVPGFSVLTSWFGRASNVDDQSAEARLRTLLNR